MFCIKKFFEKQKQNHFHKDSTVTIGNPMGL